MKYHFKPNDLLDKKQPREMGLEYTSVQRIELVKPLSIDSGSEEHCLVVIAGKAGFESGPDQGVADTKDMIYLPRNTTIDLHPEDEKALIMAFGAPAHRDTDFAHIRFTDIDRDPDSNKEYGNAAINCRRNVWHFINDDFNACRLMMGLCRGDTGGWSSWPPHQHSEEREEVYLYFGMGDAFGIQCVYEDMSDPITVALVQEGDLVVVPRGYHPNVGSPAGAISFIYCMAAKKPDERKFMDLHVQEVYGDTLK